MKCKYLIFTLILAFLFITPIHAETCDKEDIARLKNLAEHVDVSYAVMAEYQEEGQTIKDRYYTQLSNLTEELYAKNKDTEYTYTDKNTKEPYVKPGTETIYIYSSKCNTKLTTITLSLPYYNYNYNDNECENINKEFCQEWTLSKIDESTYKKELEKYKNINNPKETIENILNSNLIYIVIGIIVVIVLIIIITIVNKKRNELK